MVSRQLEIHTVTTALRLARQGNQEELKELYESMTESERKAFSIAYECAQRHPMPKK